MGGGVRFLNGKFSETLTPQGIIPIKMKDPQRKRNALNMLIDAHERFSDLMFCCSRCLHSVYSNISAFKKYQTIGKGRDKQNMAARLMKHNTPALFLTASQQFD